MNLGKLGILELKDACYRDLSGGQQQRVLLARALCAARELLILDEPITGLDLSLIHIWCSPCCRCRRSRTRKALMSITSESLPIIRFGWSWQRRCV